MNHLEPLTRALAVAAGPLIVGAIGIGLILHCAHKHDQGSVAISTQAATASQAPQPCEQIPNCYYSRGIPEDHVINDTSGNMLCRDGGCPAYWAAHGLITGTISSPSVAIVYTTAKCADGWTLVSTGFRLMCAEKLIEPETAK
jgi:hypothetical protein